uniref:ATP synthase F0 subunit 8 n=1 Tax=Bemisia tabaci TaxID=7038 RepID=A0A7S8BDS9_BEMTA|nr:ATP synthase F0 subunit 8 [Bemisia tabaci]QPB46208.1 ATP synthase F0 subunit 8 [Bemisia tabaci]
MSPISWFYLMVTFWVSWLSVVVMLFYWFNLSVFMNSNFFFFFFFYFSESELSICNMNNIIGLHGFNFCYLYNFESLSYNDF